MNFDFIKSSEPDLQNKISVNKLDVINKNILYLTHTMDKCLVVLKKLETDYKLQKKVDDYFDAKDMEHIPEVENDNNTSGNFNCPNCIQIQKIYL